MATAPALFPSQDLPWLPNLASETREKSASLLGDYSLQAVTVRTAKTGLRREGTLNAIRVLAHATEVRRAAAVLTELTRGEFRWLSENRLRYARRWVALEGDNLLAVGNSASEVYAAITGFRGTPLVTQVEPTEDIHFAGW